MILVDSSVWINYFNGRITPQSDWLNRELGQKSLLTGDIILTEVLQGFNRDKDFQTAKELLLRLPVLNMVGSEIAIKSALNYRSLRKKGVTVRKTIDVLIGTFCIAHGLVLLHEDKDFHPLEKHLKLKTVKV